MTYIALCTLCFWTLWLKDIRFFCGCFALLVVIGLATANIAPIGLISLTATAVLFYQYNKDTQYSLVYFLALLAIGVAFGLHIVPGFNNFNYINEVNLSANSGSFDIWFNYDKLAFGLLGTAFLLHKSLIKNTDVLKETLRKAAGPSLLGILSIYAVAVTMGYSKFDITFNQVFWPWALKNLVFTVLAEELLFRGLIQRELSKRFPIKGKWSYSPIVLAAALFGLAHFAGGIEYMTLSFLAGLVYGYVYKITGRIESAIAAHFLLNSAHFLFFAYPYSI